MARGEWAQTTELIGAAIRILGRENPMTIRQLFYRLVSSAAINNCLRDYQRVVKAMTKARDDGRIPFARIVDRTRPTYRTQNWKNMRQLGYAIENELMSYRRDYWQDQPNYLEVWCEKDAVTGSIEDVTQEYGILLTATRGFNSTSNAHETAQRLLNQQTADKNIVVFYLGDWDPSGESIQDDIYRRVRSYGSFDFSFRRLAIHKQDIATFHLPPLKVKPSDTRSSWFVMQHGNRAVELDALPPTELRQRLRDAIEDSISRPEWERARLVEEAQRETNRRYADTLKEMIANAAG